MPIHFACPHCAEQTLVDDQYAGLSGPCINCGRMVVVPGVAFAQSATATQAQVPAVVRSYWPLMLMVGLSVAGAAVGVAVLVSALVKPAVQAARANSMKGQCASNLRQIGAALIAYEADYGTLPPAYIADGSGVPLHSWRVLILPYLGDEEKDLHRRYDFNTPWNSPNNLMLSSRMPEVFACPADSNASLTKETSYMVVVGKNSMFPGTTATRRSQAVDGIDQTILVMEVRGSNVGWLEPKDLSDGIMMYQVGVDIGGNHAKGMNVLMCSGQTEFLPLNMPPEHVQSLVTPNGREPNPLEE